MKNPKNQNQNQNRFFFPIINRIKSNQYVQIEITKTIEINQISNNKK